MAFKPQTKPYNTPAVHKRSRPTHAEALRHWTVLEADGPINAETTPTAVQTKGKQSRKIRFAEKVRAEFAAFVAARVTRRLSQTLFYAQRSDGYAADAFTLIVSGVSIRLGISGSTSQSGRRTGLAKPSTTGRLGCATPRRWQDAPTWRPRNATSTYVLTR